MSAPRPRRFAFFLRAVPLALAFWAAWALDADAQSAAQSNQRTAVPPLKPQAARPSWTTLAHADSLLQTHRVGESLDLLETRLDEDPADFDARWRAARAAVWLGILSSGTETENAYFRRGLEHAERALVERPDDREALHWALAAKGNLAVQTGMAESARLGGEVWTLAQHVLELWPEDAEAHYALGKLEYELLKLNRVQRLMSRPFRAEMSRLSWADAVEYGQRAVELDPGSLLFRLGLADTLWRMGRHPEASAQLELAKDLPLRTPVDRDFHDRAVLLIERVAQGMDPTK